MYTNPCRAGRSVSICRWSNESRKAGPSATAASEGRTTARNPGVGVGVGVGMGDGRAGGANRPAWLQQYELVGKIGEGTYGLVFLARLKPAHPAPGRRGPPIAIKKFKQSKEGDGVSPTAIREIMVRASFCLSSSAALSIPLPFPGAGAPNPSLTYLVASQLLREINHENVVKLVNVHINHADMTLYLAFDYTEQDLYVCQFNSIPLSRA